MSTPTNSNERYIGLTLAIISAVLTGSSFVLTKVGLTDAGRNRGTSAGDSYSYLKNGKWWLGMLTMAVGEAANFAAYSFAPAILVTPLGALSVLIGAVLASVFLNEKLGREGVIGCTLSLMGSVIIILHAPEERRIADVSELMKYVVQPGFFCYVIGVVLVSGWLIYRMAPKHGKQNMLIYISICSLVGSLSVMAVKAFGIAIKLSIEGKNQLANPLTWVFALVVAVSAIIQMNYFNKALDVFSTNLVTPIYYVMFTTATITASIVLFQGFQDSSLVDIVSVFLGFGTIFTGIFMLNSQKSGSVVHSVESLPLEEKVANVTAADVHKYRSARVSEAHLLSHCDEENRLFTLKPEDDVDDV